MEHMEPTLSEMLTDAGLLALAYIKPVQGDGGSGYGIFAADGTQLAVLPSYFSACFTARENGLEPVSVH